MTHAAIQAKHREKMNAIANTLDGTFNLPGLPKRIGFVLLIAEFGQIDNGRVNYISNGERADMLAMMKEFIARAEGRYTEGGAA
ncbi:hypothetical protein [Novosphingobium sp. KN65.2]|uniref:hypothetical protein n=1 Tax=Novosphingobium sp. KN65.2 TaxID=1478134 RepID=UPI0005E01DE6|nr:hypothetical protein [Novosphingobium sp. KN65.2]CDO35796.1 hypothetical protein SPHV1_2270142 [Novosphingobium sp. KN65.2]